MTASKTYRVDLAAPGVEVRTHRDDWTGQYVTEIAGGSLDGETCTAETFLGSMVMHRAALEMARTKAAD